jgi:hypothetical protein
VVIVAADQVSAQTTNDEKELAEGVVEKAVRNVSE